jgi:hypothetical protein
VRSYADTNPAKAWRRSSGGTIDRRHDRPAAGEVEPHPHRVDGRAQAVSLGGEPVTHLEPTSIQGGGDGAEVDRKRLEHQDLAPVDEVVLQGDRPELARREAAAVKPTESKNRMRVLPA